MQIMKIRLSQFGICLGLLAIAASLTPSMIPRSDMLQGVLSGFSFVIGYFCGVAIGSAWRFMGLPTPGNFSKIHLSNVAIIFSCGFVSLSLWFYQEWHKSLVKTLGIARSLHNNNLLLVSYALLITVILLLLAKLFGTLCMVMYGRLRGILPFRIAFTVALILVSFVFWSIGNGILLDLALKTFDSSYRKYDELFESGIKQPTEENKTGSKESLISWESLGRAGREVVASGPRGADISNFTQRFAKEPIRVYVGRNSADTIEERAKLALAELKRVEAFNRKILVIATPTGTGWIDPASQSALEYLSEGDVATVSLQYSHLPSWLALLTDAEYGVESARVLFHEIYSHWRNLPKQQRPKLYLHGLSLGALHSDLSVTLLDIIDDPYHGALWSGPPFPSKTWNNITSLRNADSPEWLPRFRDGSTVRFINQSPDRQSNSAWGSFRMVFLQYASDPIVFFKARYLFREPTWLQGDRGPDVSPHFRWFPVVTFLQLLFDVMTATSTPAGVGHVYSIRDYIEAWSLVVQPADWTREEIGRLKELLKEGN